MDLLPGNPGFTIGGRVSFANGANTWVEVFDVLTSLEAELSQRGLRVETREGLLVEPNLQLIFIPRLAAGIEPLERRGVRTVTTIEVHHPILFPRGVFEYQHATGDDVPSSLRSGFSSWTESDLVAILDALRPDNESCVRMMYELPAGEGGPARTRLITLGPVTRYAAVEQDEPVEGHDPHCSCCLLTNTWESFRDLIEGDQHTGIRLLALRDADGASGADCRVNGLDHEAGHHAVLEYVSSWGGSGFDMRKQYVILHS